MKPATFAPLRSSFALLLAALVLAVIGIGWAHQFDARARLEVEYQQRALDEARARQQQGQHEARLIAQHFDTYRALVARGFVGDENRLAWIEAVQMANRDLRLYGLTYILAPRAAAPAALSGGLPLQQTRMTLKMPILIETDLPRFLDRVHATAPGVFRVDRCTLDRVVDAPSQLSADPTLEATCELIWYTLASPGGRS